MVAASVVHDLLSIIIIRRHHAQINPLRMDENGISVAGDWG
jgi:hypothetical protein